jgi:Mg2+-importing ATPase
MIRTRQVPFLQSRASWPLLGTTIAVMATGVFFAMGGLNHYFKMQALPPVFFVYLAGILMAYVGLTQTMKTFYTRRYGWQ